MESLTKTYRVIDTDTHVIEPYDLWTSRLSTERWGPLVPHVRFDEQRGEDAWFFGDTRLNPAAGPAMAGWPEYTPDRPRHIEQVDPKVWRAKERLELMDDYGIYAQVLYPNVAGFGTGRFLAMNDQDLMLGCVRAYNDFLTDFSAENPERLLPVAALPFWDIDECCKEMVHARDNNHRGVILSGQPDFWGQPTLSDPQWDPLWACAQDLEMSVNFHIGAGDLSLMESGYAGAGRHAMYAKNAVVFFVGNARTLGELICGGVCHRFPDLKFVSVESGVGWVPFALAALDWQWKNCGVPLEHPEYDLLPSEYFKRQMYACFWFEQGPELEAALEAIGYENVLYETDFPHPTSMSPGPASAAVRPDDFIDEHLSKFPSHVVSSILHDNAARLYHVA